MCSFCNGERSISTTIGELPLILHMDGENKDILKIRIERGSAGTTKPIKIRYCFMCGEKLVS